MKGVLILLVTAIAVCVGNRTQPATITKNCKFDYYYNTTVPPVILDGGRDVLLANFHGPRALKCSSMNGGLSKPAPEIMFAVVNREFLCDCQLDLEHASVLRQLSSCANSSSRMHMKFTINLAFWLIWYSTKRAYVIMICPSCIVVVWRRHRPALASSASVLSPPSHRIQDRNFIFSMNMHMCPQYMHIKYLVILTCSF